LQTIFSSPPNTITLPKILVGWITLTLRFNGLFSHTEIWIATLALQVRTHI